MVSTRGRPRRGGHAGGGGLRAVARSTAGWPAGAPRAGLDDLASPCSPLASGALWWAAAAGWNDATFRLFFLFGAILNVPWLALGTRRASSAAAVGGRPSAVGLALALGLRRRRDDGRPAARRRCPSDEPAAGQRPVRARSRASSPRSGSGVGALVVVVGAAVLSAWRLLRGRSGSAVARRAGRRAGPPGARQPPHRPRDARALRQRHAGRAARRARGVRAHPADRRQPAVRRLPRWPRSAGCGRVAPPGLVGVSARPSLVAVPPRQRRTRRRILPPMPTG